MITALGRASEQEREVLLTTHLDSNLSREDKISKVRAIYDRLNIPRLVEQQISLRFDRALSQLETLELADERKEGLREFAKSLMGRQK